MKKENNKEQKKLKSKISYVIIFFLVLLISTTIVFTGRVLLSSNTKENNKAEREHVLAKDSKNIEVIDLNNSKDDVADSKYSWSLKANQNTDVEFWNFAEGKKYSDRVIAYSSRNFIFPTNKNLSGKIGAWIYNVGTYEGKNINVKCTFDWNAYKIGNEEINPIIGIIPAKTGSERMIGFRFQNCTYKVKYEFYYGEGKNPDNFKEIPVNMSLTFGDIDGCQFFGFKSINGNINNIQCLNDTTVYYENKDEYHWFYSDNFASNNEPQATVRMELENMKSFEIVYGVPRDVNSYTDINRFLQSGDYEDYIIKHLNYYRNIFENENDENIEKNDLLGKNENNISTGWGYFTAMSYLPYDISNPIKYVSDTDEKLKKSNTILENEEFTYDIYQDIPLEQSLYYYDSFILEDTLPSCVEYINTNIYDESGIDITERFSISISDQKITISAKDTSKEAFYNNTYDFRITVKLNKEALEPYMVEEGVYKFENKASVRVFRNEKEIKKESNKVETNYYINKNKIVDIGNEEEILPGEILTYKVTYKNKSDKNEKIKIIDIVPEGTKYMGGYTTVTVNNEKVEGIKITEPDDLAENTMISWESEEFILRPEDTISVTFKVRVKTLEEGLEVNKITNKAKILHGIGEVLTEEETNEVENPIKILLKDVDIGNYIKTTSGETLTYTVKYKNTLDEAQEIVITDDIPKGTKYVSGSMTSTKESKMVELENGATSGKLVWNIEEVAVGEEVEVTFKVVVLTEKEGLNVDKITNKAIVEHIGIISGKKITDETNEVENPVEIPEVPDTSDINVWLYIAIIFIAIIGIVVGVRIINTNKKKHNKSRNM